jgi:hypothetical protein
VWLMWWVQAAAALTSSRSPLWRPHRVEVAIEVSVLLTRTASRSSPRRSHRVEVAAEALCAARLCRIEVAVEAPTPLARTAWRSPPRPPIKSAEPGPEATATRASSAAAGCAPATTTRAHVVSERHTAQEGGLVGAERGGRGR